jgi:hypothetical protein
MRLFRSLLLTGCLAGVAISAHAAVTVAETKSISSLVDQGLIELDKGFPWTRGDKIATNDYVFMSPLAKEWRTCSIFDASDDDARDWALFCFSAYHNELSDSQLMASVVATVDSYFANRPHTIKRHGLVASWTQPNGDFVGVWVSNDSGGRYYQIGVGKKQ